MNGIKIIACTLFLVCVLSCFNSLGQNTLPYSDKKIEELIQGFLLNLEQSSNFTDDKINRHYLGKYQYAFEAMFTKEAQVWNDLSYRDTTSSNYLSPWDYAIKVSQIAEKSGVPFQVTYLYKGHSYVNTDSSNNEINFEILVVKRILSNFELENYPLSFDLKVDLAIPFGRSSGVAKAKRISYIKRIVPRQKTRNFHFKNSYVLIPFIEYSNSKLASAIYSQDYSELLFSIGYDVYSFRLFGMFSTIRAGGGVTRFNISSSLRNLPLDSVNIPWVNLPEHWRSFEYTYGTARAIQINPFLYAGIESRILGQGKFSFATSLDVRWTPFFGSLKLNSQASGLVRTTANGNILLDCECPLNRSEIESEYEVGTESSVSNDFYKMQALVDIEVGFNVYFELSQKLSLGLFTSVVSSITALHRNKSKRAIIPANTHPVLQTEGNIRRSFVAAGTSVKFNL